MDNIITANELKTRGVSAIEEATSGNTEAVITVRGTSRYVVIPVEEYSLLREYELEAAIRESREDIKAGHVFDESIEEHIKRITGV